MLCFKLLSFKLEKEDNLLEATRFTGKMKSSHLIEDIGRGLTQEKEKQKEPVPPLEGSCLKSQPGDRQILK